MSTGNPTTNDSARQPADFDLGGLSIVVTGACGLIGTEICAAFAEYGALVVATDVHPAEQLTSWKAALQDRHDLAKDRIVTLTMDVVSQASVDRAFEEIDSRVEHIDVLVNLAAIDAKFEPGGNPVESARFESYPLDLLQASIDVNCTGLLRVTQAAVRRMLRQRSGNVVNVASTYSLVAPNQRLYELGDEPPTYKPVDYVATKSVVPNFTRYLATLYGGDGIRANCVVPHGVDNGHGERFRANFGSLSPLGRMCDVAELRGPFLLLASPASSYMTGSVLVVDGGWTAW
ncbi:MAG TPA: SDR family oxidoreductase [Acidimicrobiales bacterium]|nr:SDR family oxidoreductase [Acidimicrobiales bacterium]